MEKSIKYFFGLGFLCHVVLSLMIQDWHGKEKSLELMNTYWIYIPWWFWIGPLFIIWRAYDNEKAKIPNIKANKVRELPDVLWILDRMSLACPISTHSNFWIETDREEYRLCWKFICKGNVLEYATIIRQSDNKNDFLRIVHEAGKTMLRMFNEQQNGIIKT